MITNITDKLFRDTHPQSIQRVHHLTKEQNEQLFIELSQKLKLVKKEKTLYSKFISFFQTKQQEKKWKTYVDEQKNVSIQLLHNACDAFILGDKDLAKSLALRARNTLCCDKDLYNTSNMIWMLAKKEEKK